MKTLFKIILFYIILINIGAFILSVFEGIIPSGGLFILAAIFGAVLGLSTVVVIRHFMRTNKGR